MRGIKTIVEVRRNYTRLTVAPAPGHWHSSIACDGSARGLTVRLPATLGEYSQRGYTLSVRNSVEQQTAVMKFFCFLFLFVTTTGAQAQLSATGSAIPAAEAQAALETHNRMRAEVGAAPLRWSQELSVFAQAWADHLAGAGCRFQHRPIKGEWAQQYGENLFWGNGAFFNASDATNSWYGEKKDFRYGPVTESNYARIGHYTQLVWSATTEVGMGAARCRNGAWIIVANYSPRGNYVGVKPY